MADGPESLPVIYPGGREGPAVSILDDPFAILESFRRGWIKTDEEAQRQYQQALEDVAAVRATNPPPEEMVEHQVNLTKLAIAVGVLRQKNIQTAHAQTQEQAPAQHLHLHGELANMNANELRAYVASRLAVRAEPPDGNREG